MNDLFKRKVRKEVAKVRKEEISSALLFASLAPFAVTYASAPLEMMETYRP
jgi:hypothetical protein